jgi:hypothetical protein
MEPPYEDDESHPIPFVGNLDTELRSNVGVRLGVVIASPLSNDERSKQRLIQKLKGYVREFSILREQWLTENPEPMKAWLYISIHPESDPEIFQIIDQFGSWIESNSITVIVRELEKQAEDRQ